MKKTIKLKKKTTKNQHTSSTLSNKANTPKMLKRKKNFKISKTKKSDEINIFDLGTLVQFETHSWQARKKLKNEDDSNFREWTSHNKSLIKREHLKEINAIINEARTFLQTVSLPFPIKSVYFVPNDRVTIIKEILDECILKLDKKVSEFSENFAEYILEAKKFLEPKRLFNQKDYPKNLQERFKILFRFFNLTIPSAITDDIYKEESEKFQQLMEETRQMGTLALRNGFAEILGTITDALTGRLDGERKRLSQESVNKIDDFLTEFQSKNIFKDVELEKIITNAKEVIDGVTSKDLNKDYDLIKDVNEQLLEIGEELDGAIESYKRKITF